MTLSLDNRPETDEKLDLQARQLKTAVQQLARTCLDKFG